ncbi:MAG: DUF4923 family protein [Muribaculaceae bacterium]|nr:DUF4923 family protein [Muribaculaceae bacterium]
MKKVLTLVGAALLAGSFSAHAFDPSSILGALKGDSTSTSGSGSGIGDAVGGILGNVLGNSKFSVDDLVGEWDYSAPAVTFSSDDALKKIGGAGASAVVEGKLKPYYEKLKFNKTTLTVDAEHNFELKLGSVPLKGKIEKDDKDELVFNFSAFGKVPLGKVSAHATKAGNTLTLTFDATRLIQILTKLSSVLNISTLDTVSSLLNSYDGIYMGFKLKAKK